MLPCNAPRYRWQFDKAATKPTGQPCRCNPRRHCTLHSGSFLDAHLKPAIPKAPMKVIRDRYLSVEYLIMMMRHLHLPKP